MNNMNNNISNLYKIKSKKGINLYKLLSKNKNMDPYTIYATCRAWFYAENIPMSILEEIVSEDLKAKRHLLGEKFEYQV